MFLREDNDINRFCSKVATELLMPTASFMNEWKHDKNIEENITAMTRIYHVSRNAVLIRAYEHEFLPDKTYYLQPERLRQWEKSGA